MTIDHLLFGLSATLEYRRRQPVPSGSPPDRCLSRARAHSEERARPSPPPEAWPAARLPTLRRERHRRRICSKVDIGGKGTLAVAGDISLGKLGLQPQYDPQGRTGRYRTAISSGGGFAALRGRPVDHHLLPRAV